MKQLKTLLALLAALAVLGGCANSAAGQPGDASRSESAPVEQSDSKELESQLGTLKTGDYAPLRDFVNTNVQAVSLETADKMVQALIEASEDVLIEATDYIYSEEGMAVTDAIYAVCEANPELLVHPAAIYSSDKDRLLENLQDSDLKDTLADYFNQGLGLASAEGTYYFDVDYVAYSEKFGTYIDGEMADYLDIMSTEALQPLTVEEYLAVSPAELGERATAYETYLQNYPNIDYLDNVRMLLQTAVWKLVSPSPFDGMTDDDGRLSSDFATVYSELADKEDCPVLQEAVQGILAFIDTQENGAIGQYDAMEELMITADDLYTQAEQHITDLYG